MFKIEKAKESTARVVVYRELGINASYTLETSFFGAQQTSDHFENLDFSEIGKTLAIISLHFVLPGMFTRKLIFTTKFLRNTAK